MANKKIIEKSPTLKKRNFRTVDESVTYRRFTIFPNQDHMTNSEDLMGLNRYLDSSVRKGLDSNGYKIDDLDVWISKYYCHRNGNGITYTYILENHLELHDTDDGREIYYDSFKYNMEKKYNVKLEFEDRVEERFRTEEVWE